MNNSNTETFIQEDDNQTAISIKNLSKYYNKSTALSNVNLTLKKGSVMGLLGSNGSGKTTLLKILANVLKQDSGEVYIYGQTPSVYTKSVVSFLPDRQFIYDYFTVNDAVLFYKDFFNDFNEDKAQNLISFMKIDRNKKINELSKGNREKLHLAMVLSRDAKLYLLDEPIAGVDPVARDQILDAILENVNENATMLITTHLIHDIERVFDSVSFIHEGKIKLTDTVENLMNKYDNISIGNIYKKLFGGDYYA